ncbi:hypothetical protein [uncultured Roseobacter sp.]|uniref:hypothetical protein n=1 Tax=uncultured Roseobacter sp. TaxID=114847 RepID=UPI002603741B|nr:hypothetical protein [uncultured Roseobacter sp.]
MDRFQIAMENTAFVNAFWVFVGIVAGALIQWVLNYLTFRSSFRRARRVFYSEVLINWRELRSLEIRLKQLRKAIEDGTARAELVSVDMSRFAYRTIDLLINSGNFHQIFSPETMSKVFEFSSVFNQNYGNYSTGRIRDNLASEEGLAAVSHLSLILDALENSKQYLEDVSVELRMPSPEKIGNSEQ